MGVGAAGLYLPKALSALPRILRVPTLPETVYVGLFTSSGEVNGAGYARQKHKEGTIYFPQAQATWGDVRGFLVLDSNGKLLCQNTFDNQGLRIFYPQLGDTVSLDLELKYA